MRRVFVDTSAILALLVPSDSAHDRAVRVFDRLETEEGALVTTSYVLVETYALLQARAGLSAMRAFRDDFAGLLEVAWIDSTRHDRALDVVLARGKRKISLVAAASFTVMRALKLDTAFAYDADFGVEGFETL